MNRTVGRRWYLRAMLTAAGAAEAWPEPGRNARKWLPFHWRETHWPAKEALSARPRLLGRPDDLALWKHKAAAIPAKLWQPRQAVPTKLPPPNPKGNGGRPDALLALAAAWLATGNEFYVEDARQAMLRVAAYPHWGIPGKALDHDLDGGGLLLGLAVGYDTFYERLPPEDRDTIRAKLILQCRRMYEHHHVRTAVQWEQNHTYIALGGLFCAASALYGELPETREWYELGARAIQWAVHLLDSGDGAFYEGISYWNFGFALHLLPQMEIFRNVTGADPFAGFAALRNLKHYLLHALHPGGEYWLNLGDVGHSTVARSSLERARYVALKLAAEYQDPEYRFLADYFAEVNDLDPANDPWILGSFDPAIQPADPRKTWAPVHHFRDLDLVSIRSNWTNDATHLAMRCGPALGHRGARILVKGEVPGWKPSTGHVHPDLNSFILFDHGEHMVVDTGYTWTKLTRDHSTVVVDGGGQVGDGIRWPGYAPWDRFGRIGSFVSVPDCSYVRGEAAGGYQESLRLGRADRHILMLPDSDNTCLLVHDIFESADPHRYEWLLLTAQPAERVGDGEFRMRSGKRALTIRVNGRFESVVEPVVVTERPMPGSVKERGHRLILRPASQAPSFEIEVMLALHDAAVKAPAIEFVDGAWRIQQARWTDTLAPNGSGGGIVSDGHHSAARRAQSRLTAWAVNDARRLTIDGREVCSAALPISAAACLRAERHLVSVVAARATQVFIAGKRPSRCTLDGKPMAFRHEAGRLRVAIPAGSHQLEYF